MLTKVKSSAYYISMASADILVEGRDLHPIALIPTESTNNSNRWSFKNSVKGAFIGIALSAAALGVVVATNESLVESADLAKILLVGGAGSGALVGGVRRFREKIRTGFWSILQTIPRHTEISW